MVRVENFEQRNLSQKHRKDKTIKEIYIVSKSENIVSPCGGCRQKIREFSSDQTKIFLCNIKWDYKLFSLNELLPFSFSEFDDL